MNKVIRIGTRDSVLAMWQANFISQALQDLGQETEIIPINTQGDQVTTIPLYEFGVSGVFTKTLDIALLENQVDIAVHSMKDVPTVLPKGLSEWAVPERAITHDVVVHNGTKEEFESATERIVATSSLRRQAQWLHQYPTDQTTGIRGNVITRLEKVKNNPWNGAIFAEAGLSRIDMLPENAIRLDWMVPAAAQGALLVAGRDNNPEMKQIVAQLNHKETALAVKIERDFMHDLNAGCTAPVGALVKVKGDTIYFTGVVHSLDGKKEVRLDETCNLHEAEGLGTRFAEIALAQGAKEILDTIRKND